MDQNLITAMAGALGSVTGASAAIATTWISQKNQTIRERAKSETRKLETLNGDFITEARCSFEFFIASENSGANAELAEVIGTDAAMLSEQDIQRIADDPLTARL